MTDKPISVGDLVVVTKAARCGCTQSLGFIFKVVDIRLSSPFGSVCSYCRTNHDVQEFLAFAEDDLGAEPHRLKRIPPLDELEGASLAEGDLAEQRRIHDQWAKA